MLENQSTKADGRWHIAEKSFDLGALGEITHDNRWCRSDVRACRFCVPNIVDDCHDRSSRKTPLPGAPLSVFFTGRYLVHGEPHLVQRTITDGDEIYTDLAPRKQVKVVRPVPTLVLLVFGEIAVTI